MDQGQYREFPSPPPASAQQVRDERTGEAFWQMQREISHFESQTRRASERREFAAMMMQGLLMQPGARKWSFEEMADIAIHAADALVAKLNEPT